MIKRWDCFLIGRACIDILTQVNKYPPEDSKVVVSGWKQVGGGQASTCSYLMASLGGKVAFIGRLGMDPEGDQAIEEMEKFGVNCSFVKRDANFVTPKAFIAINKKTGSRTIFYEPATGPGLKKTDLPLSEILSSKTVLIDPQEIQVGVEIIDQLKKNKCYTILDAERIKEDLEILVPKVDALIVSRSYIEERFPQLTIEDSLKKLYSERLALTAITLGEQGVIALYKDKIITVPSLPVTVKDTTGAGDNFHAAFALAIARNRDIPNSLAYASAVASLTCRGIGGRSAFPTKREAEVGFSIVASKMEISSL
jgi:sugar/nucleoside kinase (ribokinase family)